MGRWAQVRSALIAILMVTLAAVSCTGQEPSALELPQQTTVVEVEEQVPPTSLPFVEPESIDSQVRLGLTRPASFLPNEVSMLDQNAVIISDLLYDGVVEADPTAETLRPALASEWSHDDNFTTWTFTIENEARVKPSMVVAHFQRLISSPPSGTTAFLLGSITSVSVDEENKVVFELVGPNAGFAWMLSGLQFSVVGNDGAPTGRYRIDSDSDERMILDAIDASPRVIVNWTPDGLEAYNMMTLGQLDAAVVDPEDIPDAKLRFGSAFEDLSISKFFVLNPRSELTSTTAGRKSFHLAIDQADMLDKRLPESVVSASSILATSLAGTNETDCELVCQFDAVRAEAQFGSDVIATSIRVGVIWPDQYGVGEEIAEDLADAGLSSEVVEVTNEKLSEAVFDGDVELFSFGWIAGSTSIDAVVPAVLGPSSPVEPSTEEAAPIRELLAQAAITEVDADRWKLLNEAYEVALELGLILPISNETHRLARTPAAKELVVRADGSIDMLR